VRVWDAQSGAELAVLRGREEDYVTSVSYSPDGRRIVSGSSDKAVRVWDAQSGAELAVLRGHEGWVNSVSYNLDGRRIVGNLWDNKVTVWDAETYECLEESTTSGDGISINSEGLSGLPWCVIIESTGVKPVSWFPIDLWQTSTHPNGRALAGCSFNNLYIIALEGWPEGRR
jgi:WD40 repeat protein